MATKSKTTIFIEKARLKHGDKYDYSLIEYANKISKVKIICSEHGIFEQRPDSHLSGCGCQKCSGIYKPSTEEFVIKAKEIHGNKYDYSLVDYKKSNDKITIICPTHGNFETTPNNHLNGKDCPNCKGNLAIKLDTNEFIKKAKEIHANKYDYSLVDYKNFKSKVKINCDKHGVFEQTPFNHITNKHGCQICKLSHGERVIYRFLTQRNIKNINNFSFDDCRDKNPLPFDFYLPEHNICVEFDGEQHFKAIPYFGGLPRLKLQQKRDKIKSDYCENNNIKLIRISDIDKIETVLNENVW